MPAAVADIVICESDSPLDRFSKVQNLLVWPPGFDPGECCWSSHHGGLLEGCILCADNPGLCMAQQVPQNQIIYKEECMEDLLKDHVFLPQI